MADILIMEPDGRIGAHMYDALTDAGYMCMALNDVAQGLPMVHQGGQLLTILNARLPWTESCVLLRILQEKDWPVLFITGDANNVEHLRAMYQGCCDVLLSPYDDDALLATVASLQSTAARTLTHGPLRLDTESRTATMDGEELSLTAQEFALLQALMRSPDSALTREELLRTAWGYQGIGETRTVDVHVQRLRRKIGATCIETVYKLGYRLKLA